MNLVLLSGGIDSLVCAALAAKEDLAVLHLNYGQRTQNQEEACFHKIADYYKIPEQRRKVLKLDFLKDLITTPLIQDNLNSESLQTDNTSGNYVPFRNTLFLSLAVAWAECLPAQNILIGAHQEDHAGFPDCRPSFFQAFQQVIQEGSKEGTVKVKIPLIRMSKTEVIQLGKKLNVPFQYTWSCYYSQDLPCGHCESCLVRSESFTLAQVQDPLTQK